VFQAWASDSEEEQASTAPQPVVHEVPAAVLTWAQPRLQGYLHPGQLSEWLQRMEEAGVLSWRPGNPRLSTRVSNTLVAGLCSPDPNQPRPVVLAVQRALRQLRLCLQPLVPSETQPSQEELDRATTLDEYRSLFPVYMSDERFADFVGSQRYKLQEQRLGAEEEGLLITGEIQFLEEVLETNVAPEQFDVELLVALFPMVFWRAAGVRPSDLMFNQGTVQCQSKLQEECVRLRESAGTWSTQFGAEVQRLMMESDTWLRERVQPPPGQRRLQPMALNFFGRRAMRQPASSSQAAREHGLLYWGTTHFPEGSEVIREAEEHGMLIEQAERDRWSTWAQVRAEERGRQMGRVMVDSGANLLAINASLAAQPQPPRVLLPPPPQGYPPLLLPPPPPGWLLEEVQAGAPVGLHEAGQQFFQLPPGTPQQDMATPMLVSDSDSESCSSDGHRYWGEEDEWDSLSTNGGDTAAHNVNENF
jgi:hypothetical protein